MAAPGSSTTMLDQSKLCVLPSPELLVARLGRPHGARHGLPHVHVDALRAGGFTDLVLTSANGARSLASALTAANMDARDLAGVHTWAVGPATARAMRSLVGIAADEVPAEPNAEGLVAHAAALGVEGRAFLFPAAAAARQLLHTAATRRRRRSPIPNLTELGLELPMTCDAI